MDLLPAEARNEPLPNRLWMTRLHLQPEQPLAQIAYATIRTKIPLGVSTKPRLILIQMCRRCPSLPPQGYGQKCSSSLQPSRGIEAGHGQSQQVTHGLFRSEEAILLFLQKMKPL